VWPTTTSTTQYCRSRPLALPVMSASVVGALRLPRVVLVHLRRRCLTVFPPFLSFLRHRFGSRPAHGSEAVLFIRPDEVTSTTASRSWPCRWLSVETDEDERPAGVPDTESSSTHPPGPVPRLFVPPVPRPGSRRSLPSHPTLRTMERVSDEHADRFFLLHTARVGTAKPGATPAPHVRRTVARFTFYRVGVHRHPLLPSSRRSRNSPYEAEQPPSHHRWEELSGTRHDAFSALSAASPRIRHARIVNYFTYWRADAALRRRPWHPPHHSSAQPTKSRPWFALWGASAWS